MQQQSDQRRDAHDLRDFVGLLAEMEVPAERVLGQVHEQIRAQCDERSPFAAPSDRFGEEIEHGDRDQKSRGQRQYEVEGA